MTISFRRAALAAALCAGFVAAPALAREHSSSPIQISNAWAPAPPPGAPTAAGYLTIANHGGSADRLLDGSTPAAAEVQVHSMTTQGGVMRMRPLAGGLAVDAGAVVTLKPEGGMHLMLIGLKRRLRAGDHLPVTLRFARAGAVRVDFVVRGQGASEPAMQMGPHGHMDMGGR